MQLQMQGNRKHTKCCPLPPLLWLDAFSLRKLIHTPAVSGIPTASERGGDQKWPTCGQSGYVTPAVSGIPTVAEPGGEIRSGPLVGKVATSPLPYRGSPALHSGGQNQKWPTSGQGGYVTPAVSGIPTAAELR